MSHPHMVLTEAEACGMSRRPGVCAIMATGAGRFDIFSKSLLSLLLRSDALDHVFVCVNGPRRPQSQSQDLCQSFVEALEDAGAPVTLLRVWGHVGHAQCLDMAMSWVFTSHYLVMHDDVFVLRRDWAQTAISMLNAPGVVAAVYPNMSAEGQPVVRMCGLRGMDIGGKPTLVIPHPNTAFTVCTTAETVGLGGAWRGYSVDLAPPRWVSELARPRAFFEYWEEHGGIDGSAPAGCRPYEVISQDVGAWLLYRAGEAGKQWALLPRDTVLHLERTSWGTPGATDAKLQAHDGLLKELCSEFLASKYRDVYLRFEGTKCQN